MLAAARRRAPAVVGRLLPQRHATAVARAAPRASSSGADVAATGPARASRGADVAAPSTRGHSPARASVDGVLRELAGLPAALLGHATRAAGGASDITAAGLLAGKSHRAAEQVRAACEALVGHARIGGLRIGRADGGAAVGLDALRALLGLLGTIAKPRPYIAPVVNAVGYITAYKFNRRIARAGDDVVVDCLDALWTCASAPFLSPASRAAGSALLAGLSDAELLHATHVVIVEAHGGSTKLGAALLEELLAASRAERIGAAVPHGARSSTLDPGDEAAQGAADERATGPELLPPHAPAAASAHRSSSSSSSSSGADAAACRRLSDVAVLVERMVSLPPKPAYDPTPGVGSSAPDAPVWLKTRPASVRAAISLLGARAVAGACDALPAFAATGSEPLLARAVEAGLRLHAVAPAAAGPASDEVRSAAARMVLAVDACFSAALGAGGASAAAAASSSARPGASPAAEELELAWGTASVRAFMKGVDRLKLRQTLDALAGVRHPPAQPDDAPAPGPLLHGASPHSLLYALSLRHLSVQGALPVGGAEAVSLDAAKVAALLTVPELLGVVVTMRRDASAAGAALRPLLTAALCARVTSLPADRLCSEAAIEHLLELARVLATSSAEPPAGAHAATTATHAAGEHGDGATARALAHVLEVLGARLQPPPLPPRSSRATASAAEPPPLRLTSVVLVLDTCAALLQQDRAATRDATRGGIVALARAAVAAVGRSETFRFGPLTLQAQLLRRAREVAWAATSAVAPGAAATVAAEAACAFVAPLEAAVLQTRRSADWQREGELPVLCELLEQAGSDARGCAAPLAPGGLELLATAAVTALQRAGVPPYAALAAGGPASEALAATQPRASFSGASAWFAGVGDELVARIGTAAALAAHGATVLAARYANPTQQERQGVSRAWALAGDLCDAAIACLVSRAVLKGAYARGAAPPSAAAVSRLVAAAGLLGYAATAGAPALRALQQLRILPALLARPCTLMPSVLATSAASLLEALEAAEEQDPAARAAIVGVSPRARPRHTAALVLELALAAPQAAPESVPSARHAIAAALLRTVKHGDETKAAARASQPLALLPAALTDAAAHPQLSAGAVGRVAPFVDHLYAMVQCGALAAAAPQDASGRSAHQAANSLIGRICRRLASDAAVEHGDDAPGAKAAVEQLRRRAGVVQRALLTARATAEAAQVSALLAAPRAVKSLLPPRQQVLKKDARGRAGVVDGRALSVERERALSEGSAAGAGPGDAPAGSSDAAAGATLLASPPASALASAASTSPAQSAAARTVHLYHWPLAAKRKVLVDHMSQVGTVEFAQVHGKSHTSTGRFCVVTYARPEDAAEAVRRFHRSPFQDKIISVRPAQPAKSTASGAATT